MEEVWKTIPGFEVYQVSNTGKVKAIGGKWPNGLCYKEHFMKPTIDRHGYALVRLTTGLEKSKMCFIHRLVAMAFIDNPDNLPIINHKDENPLNNNVENLEWCDYSYNLSYGKRKEKFSEKVRGEKSPRHKLTEDDVRTIKRIATRYDPELSYVALAKRYGVTPVSIRYIVIGKNWKHI